MQIFWRLDWKEHIREVCKKISKGNYLLWRHKRKLNSSTRKLLYESFVKSHILYCITVWGRAKKVVLKPLNSLLSKIWKKLDNTKEHTFTKLKRLKILKLEDEQHIQECKLVRKWSRSKIPPGLKDILTEKNDRLRRRRFIKSKNVNQDSINSRLASKAEKYIATLSQIETRKRATKVLREELFSAKYSFVCTNRHCSTCR